MVTNVTNFSRSGLFDWVAQRLSALVLLTYFLFLFFFVVTHPNMSYESWYQLFDHVVMRIFSVLALLALLVHAWVGMWTITTDYLTTMAFGRCATGIRLVAQVFCGLLMFVMFLWGIRIIWSL